MWECLLDYCFVAGYFSLAWHWYSAKLESHPGGPLAAFVFAVSAPTIQQAYFSSRTLSMRPYRVLSHYDRCRTPCLLALGICRVMVAFPVHHSIRCRIGAALGSTPHSELGQLGQWQQPGGPLSCSVGLCCPFGMGHSSKASSLVDSECLACSPVHRCVGPSGLLLCLRCDVVAAWRVDVGAERHLHHFWFTEAFESHWEKGRIALLGSGRGPQLGLLVSRPSSRVVLLHLLDVVQHRGPHREIRAFGQSNNWRSPKWNQGFALLDCFGWHYFSRCCKCL